MEKRSGHCTLRPNCPDVRQTSWPNRKVSPKVSSGVIQPIARPSIDIAEDNLGLSPLSPRNVKYSVSRACKHRSCWTRVSDQLGGKFSARNVILVTTSYTSPLRPFVCARYFSNNNEKIIKLRESLCKSISTYYVRDIRQLSIPENFKCK